MSRTIYWEEVLFFEYKKIIIPENIQNENEENGKGSNSFEISDPKKLLERMKDEYIKFSIFEHYHQGQEIFLCSTKLKIEDLLKKNNKFLFDLFIKEKQLGTLKIGI